MNSCVCKMADDGTKRRLWLYKSDLEEEPDEEKLLEILKKLRKLHVTIAALQETGIGKLVNRYRKREGIVGQLAGKVVADWKCLVENEVELLDKSGKRSPSRSNETSHDENSNGDDGNRHYSSQIKNLKSVKKESTNSLNTYNKEHQTVEYNKDKNSESESDNERQTGSDDDNTTNHFVGDGGADHAKTKYLSDSSDSDEDTYKPAKHKYQPTKIKREPYVEYTPSKISKYRAGSEEYEEREHYSPQSRKSVSENSPYIPSTKARTSHTSSCDSDNEARYEPISSKRKLMDEPHYEPSPIKKPVKGHENTGYIPPPSQKRQNNEFNHSMKTEEDLTDSDEDYTQGHDTSDATKIEEYYQKMLAQSGHNTKSGSTTKEKEIKNEKEKDRKKLEGKTCNLSNDKDKEHIVPVKERHSCSSDRHHNENKKLKHSGDKDRRDRDKLKHSWDTDRHDRDKLKHSGDKDRHDRDKLKHPGDKDRHDRDKLKHPGDKDRHDRDKLKHPGDKDRHDRDEMKKSGDRERHRNDNNKDSGKEKSSRDKDRKKSLKDREKCKIPTDNNSRNNVEPTDVEDKNKKKSGREEERKKREEHGRMKQNRVNCEKKDLMFSSMMDSRGDQNQSDNWKIKSKSTSNDYKEKHSQPMTGKGDGHTEKTTVKVDRKRKCHSISDDEEEQSYYSKTVSHQSSSNPSYRHGRTERTREEGRDKEHGRNRSVAAENSNSNESHGINSNRTETELHYTPTKKIKIEKDELQLNVGIPAMNDSTVEEELYSPTYPDIQIKQEKPWTSKSNHVRYSPTPVSAVANVKKEKMSSSPFIRNDQSDDECYSPILSQSNLSDHQSYSPTPIYNCSSERIKNERYSPQPVQECTRLVGNKYSPTPIKAKLKIKEKESMTDKNHDKGHMSRDKSSCAYKHSLIDSLSHKDYSTSSSSKDLSSSKASTHPYSHLDSHRHSKSSRKHSESKNRSGDDKSVRLKSGGSDSSSLKESEKSSKEKKGKFSSNEKKFSSSSSVSQRVSKGKDWNSNSLSHKSHKLDSSSQSKVSDSKSASSSSHGKEGKSKSDHRHKDSHTSSKLLRKSEERSSSSSISKQKKQKNKKISMAPQPDLDLFADIIQIKAETAHPGLKSKKREENSRTTPLSTSNSEKTPHPSVTFDSKKTSSSSTHSHKSKRKSKETDMSNSNSIHLDLEDKDLQSCDEDNLVEEELEEEDDESKKSFEYFMSFDESSMAKKGRSVSKSSKDRPSSSHAGKQKTKSFSSKDWKSSLDLPSSSKTNLTVPVPSKDLSEIEKDIRSMLPQTQATYKPLRLNHYFKDEEIEEPPTRLVDPDSVGVKSVTRTQVYSGRRHGATEVKPLYDLCMQILIENIDSIDYVGGIPYSILKPVLERCSAQQLCQLEDFNPHFLEDTDELWKNLCVRDFRGSNPDELESWRELYMRRFEEREAKYQKLKETMSSSIVKGQAGRKAQLAYVDTVAKPPREVLRKQKQYGTGCISKNSHSGSGLKKYKPSVFVPAHNPMNDRPRMVKPMPPMMAKSLQMRKNMRR